MQTVARITQALLWIAIPALTHGQDLAAQSRDSQRVTPQQLDYYLVQAFNAPTSAQRLALNHIGIQGQQSAEGFLITSVLESYPAHRAGVNRGDIITAANGQPFHPVRSFNPSSSSSGAKHTTPVPSELSINRGGTRITATVTPIFENLYDSFRAANAASVQQFNSGNKVVGYVHLWALSRSSNDLISTQRLFEELAQCDGIILDLRDSFGFVDREHLELSLPAGASIDIDRPLGWLKTITSGLEDLPGEAYRRPLAILVNARTRGGPELLAHELGKSERIVTMGKPTPGRIGSYTLDRSANTADYQPATETLVDGEVFEDSGLAPEIVIEFPIFESRRDDPQFDAAFNQLMGVI
jgi:carboxyl-terminal processing protease